MKVREVASKKLACWEKRNKNEMKCDSIRNERRVSLFFATCCFIILENFSRSKKQLQVSNRSLLQDAATKLFLSLWRHHDLLSMLRCGNKTAFISTVAVYPIRETAMPLSLYFLVSHVAHFPRSRQLIVVVVVSSSTDYAIHFLFRYFRIVVLFIMICKNDFRTN